MNLWACLRARHEVRDLALLLAPPLAEQGAPRRGARRGGRNLLTDGAV